MSITMSTQWSWVTEPTDLATKAQQEAEITAIMSNLDRIKAERINARFKHERASYYEEDEEFEDDAEELRAKAKDQAAMSIRNQQEEFFRGLLSQFSIKIHGPYDHHGEDAQRIQFQEDAADAMSDALNDR